MHGILLAIAETYKAGIVDFGGETSTLPTEVSALNLSLWLKSHLGKLSAFVGGSVDFGALAGVTSLAKHLVRKGYSHADAIPKETFSSTEDLGDTPSAVRRSVHNFMSSFWVPFGQATAHEMAERKPEVRSLICFA